MVDLFTKYLLIYYMCWNGVIKHVQASAYNNNSTIKYVASNWFFKNIIIVGLIFWVSFAPVCCISCYTKMVAGQCHVTLVDLHLFI